MLDAKEIKFEIRRAGRALWRALPAIACISYGAIGIALWQYNPGQLAEIRSLRFCFSTRGPSAPTAPVAIVAIDDTTYQSLGISPRSAFPREYLSNALETLSTVNPRLVILDANIPQEKMDPAVQQRITRSLQKLPINGMRKT